MSIFGSEVRNLDYSPAVNVEEAAGYDDGIHSAQIAQIEGLQNHLALFEGGIKTDIQAAYMVIEGVGEEEVFAFSEGVVGDMLKRIKEFFMKLWAKIKAIFKGFMARIDAQFMKSNKEFINKYKKDIIGKDLTDFEVTYRKRKNGKTLNLADFDISSLDNDLDAGQLAGKTDTELKDIISKFDSEDCKEKLLGSFVGNTSGVSEKEFEKEAFDYIYEDEDSNEVTQGDISTIMTRMMGAKDAKKTIEKANKDLEKAIRDAIKALERHQNDIFKMTPANDKDAHASFKFGIGDKNNRKNTSVAHTGDNASSDGSAGTDYHITGTGDKAKEARGTAINQYQSALGHVSKVANIIQSCATKYTSVQMKIVNFDNKQDRKILARAVAYNRKKDESVMMEALAELADWEADVVFD